MSLYSEGKKRATLKYIHCWHIAKNSPKWAQVPLAGQSSSKRSKSCSFTSRSDARTDFEVNLSEMILKPNGHREKISKKSGPKNHLLRVMKKTPLWPTSKKKSTCSITSNKKETLKK
ncbi:hypothetical protein Hanom_Chr11g01047471 [Helianthus anomalus]